MSIYEAAKQALDALYLIRDGATGLYGDDLARCNRALEILSAALADEQDWDELEALRASLREHMAEIHRLREAGRQALDALEAAEFHAKRRIPDASIEVVVKPAITGLRDALSWDAMQRLTDVQQEIENDSFDKQPASGFHSRVSDSTDRGVEAVTDVQQQMEAALADQATYGMSITLGGKRIDPASIYKQEVPQDHIADASNMVATSQESRQVEPVAHITGYSKGRCIIEAVDPDWLLPVGMALYRSPSQREPLTDWEIQRCIYEVDDARLAGPITKFARSIERAHGIGG